MSAVALALSSDGGDEGPPRSALLEGARMIEEGIVMASGNLLEEIMDYRRELCRYQFLLGNLTAAEAAVSGLLTDHPDCYSCLAVLDALQAHPDGSRAAATVSQNPAQDAARARLRAAQSATKLQYAGFVVPHDGWVPERRPLPRSTDELMELVRARRPVIFRGAAGQSVMQELGATASLLRTRLSCPDA